MRKNLVVSLSCAIALTSAAIAVAMPDKSSASVAEKAVQPAEQLSGKVLQTMDSGGYSYIYIQKKNGDKVWVAVTETPVKVGSQMTFRGGMEMPNFESKSLKRKFDTIIFADGVVTDNTMKDKAADSSKDKSSTSAGSKGAVVSKDAKISVTKASGPNATTVQGAFANSAKLDKKKVVIRGKVVKVSAQIMGKNWIHIQDGTGSQAAANHNLVCTSKDMADVGDVVTVSGVLAKDKDFGGGYKYAVIIEEATIKK